MNVYSHIFTFFNYYSEGVESSWFHFGTAVATRPIVPAPGDYDDEEICGMMTGMENRSTRENLPQCRFVHQKPHIPAQTQTRATAVGSQLITASATTQPQRHICIHFWYVVECGPTTWQMAKHSPKSTLFYDQQKECLFIVFWKALSLTQTVQRRMIG
jgi:hypothetical protein